jgi:hypothetical protein
MTPPPEGTGHRLNDSVFGLNHTSMFGVAADSAYQMISLTAVIA